MIEVIPEQPPKASYPIMVTVFGMLVALQPKMSSLSLVLMMTLQFSLESKTALSAATSIETNEAQP